MLQLQAFPARDLKIVIDTKGRLQVDSPSEPLSIVTLAFLSCVFAGLCYVVYRLWPVSRLVLTTSDGQLVRPLGPDFNNMDNQFKVLEEMQHFLAQQQTHVATP